MTSMFRSAHENIRESSRFPSMFSLRTLLVLIAGVFFYQTCCYVYNLFFHPLRRFPGPKLWAVSRIPHEFAFCRGRIHVVLKDLHARYGDTVRIGPNSLSFVHPDAWNDIYGRQPTQSRPFPRDPLRFSEDLWIDGAPDVWTSPDEVHPRLRRALSPLFSDKALKSYRSTIMRHVDNFTGKIDEMSSNDGVNQGKVDFSTWLSFVMYDVVGDLAFGEPFECVSKGRFHPWLARIVESGRAVVFFGAIRQFPWIQVVLERLVRPMLEQALKEQQRLCIDKVNRRLTDRKGKSDFLEVLLDSEGQSDGLTRPEVYPNATFLILAGSETSATVMAGTLYHLGTKPQAFQDVVKEIRSKYTYPDDITFESLRDLPVLTAAIDESMRMYPGALYSPRVAPKGGANVCGQFVPEGTSVCVYQSVAYYDKSNFTNPFTYDPQRFLDDSRYASDRKEAFKPFSVGPKNCLGYKLAYFQMKLILASIILQYDIELCPESANWSDQEVFFLPDRPPLMMKAHRGGKK